LAKPVTKDQLYSAIEIAFSNFNGIKLALLNQQAEVSAISKEGLCFCERWTLLSERSIIRNCCIWKVKRIMLLFTCSSGKKILIRSSLDDFIRQLDQVNCLFVFIVDLL
jgi:hypothetical protein